MAISGVADLTGRVLAGRYRLLAPIGAGASGRVYVADDVRLRRRVAIKVLHAALAEDSGFLRRFRAEAQVAASLNHPNVMAVYDWGDDDVPFMVLELLTGGSLRSLLDSGTRLSPSQAAHVGRQVTERVGVRPRAWCRAPRHQARQPAVRRARHRAGCRLRPRPRTRGGELDGARGHGRRHRALRRARAGHGRAARRPRRSLFARDRALRVGHRAPCPTSRRPRSARSPRARRTPLVAPLELGRLGPVVERAGRPDPAERYPDAATMRDALADAASALPPPQPLALSGLFGDFDTGEPTQLGRALQTLQVFDQDASEPSAPVPSPLVVQERRRRAPGAQPMVSVIVTLVVVLAVAFAGYAVASSTASTVAAPSVVGLAHRRGQGAHRRRRARHHPRRAGRRRPEGHGDRAASRSGSVRARARRRRVGRVARASAR